MTAFRVLVAVGLAAILAGTSYALRPLDVEAVEPPFDVTALRSEVAGLRAALYVADQQACLNVGVMRTVPPPTKRGRR